MIGYYAHGHGSGHCNYAQILASFLRKEMTVFTDSDFTFQKEVDVVRLPDENTNGQEFNRNRYPTPNARHSAPIGLSKITRRSHRILGEILKRDIRLMIVDVSVEIAMLCRVSSVPYAYVRLQGDRNDFAHLNAFEGATFLLAYFPVSMELENTPGWVRKKTVYLGFISKFIRQNQISPKPSEFLANGKPDLLYITGFGESRPINFGKLKEQFNIYALGPGSFKYGNNEVITLGIVPSTRSFIVHANIILASCGSNTTSEILNSGKTFLAIEEHRYYREHISMANNLFRNGWALPLSKYGSVEEAVLRYSSVSLNQAPAVEIEKLLDFCTMLSKGKFWSYIAADMENTTNKNAC
ncbi:MAG: hypothetical protein WBB27_11505 [Maribacter sp.]